MNILAALESESRRVFGPGVQVIEVSGHYACTRCVFGELLRHRELSVFGTPADARQALLGLLKALPNDLHLAAERGQVWTKQVTILSSMGKGGGIVLQCGRTSAPLSPICFQRSDGSNLLSVNPDGVCFVENFRTTPASRRSALSTYARLHLWLALARRNEPPGSIFKVGSSPAGGPDGDLVFIDQRGNTALSYHSETSQWSWSPTDVERDLKDTQIGVDIRPLKMAPNPRTNYILEAFCAWVDVAFESISGLSGITWRPTL